MRRGEGNMALRKSVSPSPHFIAMIRTMTMISMAGAAVAAPPPPSGNMNGKYAVMSGSVDGRKEGWADWNDDYKAKGYEYFDTWAPEMATHYGEVFWTDQGTVPLPPAIVKRFEGKVMAIMGYEQDQVMVNPTGKPGVNPSEDVSVPINWAYNHHYMAWMTGKNAKIVKRKMTTEESVAKGMHGIEEEWVDMSGRGPQSGAATPTSQMFSEGNGGESRKSLHGYPSGHAQLIESPQSWHITPMQIDTRNRDCGANRTDVKNCTPQASSGPKHFTPGPEPKQARYGRGTPEGTNYSGVLECPCNGRYGGDEKRTLADGTVVGWYSNKTKVVAHFYTVQVAPTCAKGEGMDSAESCFLAAANVGLIGTIKNLSTTNTKLMPGCSVTETAPAAYTVSYNAAKSTVPGAAPAVLTGAAATAVGVKLNVKLDNSAGGSSMNNGPKGKYCSLNKKGVLKKFVPKTASVADAVASQKQCVAFCTATAACHACSIDCEQNGNPTGICQFVALPSCGVLTKWQGKIAGDTAQKGSAGVATIAVSGPSAGWFGVGLNAKVMSDAPYTLVVNSTGVFERKIGTCGSEAEHCPGKELSASIKLVSNTVVGAVRTVVVTRGFAGASKDHYSFAPATQATVPFISAIGWDQTFAYHKVGAAGHATSALSFTAVGKAIALCDLGANGKLCLPGGTGCGSFVKNCVGGSDVAETGGSLLVQRNPTCNSRQYVGGLSCCHHKRIMLDADQEVRPELLRYHMKWRFWFQEYKPATQTVGASHVDLPRIYQQTEADAGEYDIPPAFWVKGKDPPIAGYPNVKPWPALTPGSSCKGDCPNGPSCECVHTIHYKWTVSNMRLIYAGGHCHAPACLGIFLYRNDTGKMLCSQLPKYGSGNVAEDKYDESGYLALPPCLWGPDKGLQMSEKLPPNTPLLSIKINRNTHLGHFGEMASWQMRGTPGGVKFEPNQDLTKE